MNIKKTICRKLKDFAEEEKKTYEEYKKMGFVEQANDERKHAKFFKKKIRNCR